MGAMAEVTEALDELVERLAALGWVTDVLVGGSWATGDHRAGVSDLDLLALVDGPVGGERVARVRAVHSALDTGVARGMSLGCVYVDAGRLEEVGARHPTWTHGVLVQRPLSALARVDLVQHGRALRGHGLRGRPPAALLPPADAAVVRAAVVAELDGYWTWAVRRPWLWLDRDLAELGLLTMARTRHALEHGELVTKTAVLHDVAAPRWLARRIRARRAGVLTRVPSVLAPVGGAIAWRDAVRTTTGAAGPTTNR
jgi:predicted nucleotidyltransferase